MFKRLFKKKLTFSNDDVKIQRIHIDVQIDTKNDRSERIESIINRYNSGNLNYVDKLFAIHYISGALLCEKIDESYSNDDIKIVKSIVKLGERIQERHRNRNKYAIEKVDDNELIIVDRTTGEGFSYKKRNNAKGEKLVLMKAFKDMVKESTHDDNAETIEFVNDTLNDIKKEIDNMTSSDESEDIQETSSD